MVPLWLIKTLLSPTRPVSSSSIRPCQKTPQHSVETRHNRPVSLADLHLWYTRAALLRPAWTECLDMLPGTLCTMAFHA